MLRLGTKSINMKTFIYIFLKVHTLFLSLPHYPPKLPLPLKKTTPNYKTIANAGSEGREAEEIYHTYGPPCFIMYLQVPAKG